MQRFTTCPFSWRWNFACQQSSHAAYVSHNSHTPIAIVRLPSRRWRTTLAPSCCFRARGSTAIVPFLRRLLSVTDGADAPKVAQIVRSAVGLRDDVVDVRRLPLAPVDVARRIRRENATAQLHPFGVVPAFVPRRRRRVPSAVRLLRFLGGAMDARFLRHHAGPIWTLSVSPTLSVRMPSALTFGRRIV